VRQSCMQKWTFLCKIGSKNDQSFCHVHNEMIQKKLQIPGKMERASLETDESWREVSWWRKNIQVESHVESYVNLNGTDLGEVALFTSQYHSDSRRKLHRLDNFESHGLEIMSEMTAKPMWKWNLESFAQETSC
jgi:predicted nucleotide-binding protein (sugar kinase/HSP70/actin superfamily)